MQNSDDEDRHPSTHDNWLSSDAASGNDSSRACSDNPDAV